MIATAIHDIVVFVVVMTWCTLWWGLDLLKQAFFCIVPLPRKSISDDIVLVTGAAMGIGKLQALRFASQKPRMVICWDMNTVENEKTAKEIEALGVPTLAYTVDLSKVAVVQKIGLETKKALQKKLNDNNAFVSILVNNAGIVTGKKLLNCPDHLNQLTMDVNCNAHFWTLKQFLPDMMKYDHGHVVTIASGAGLGACAGLVDYCASKFAAVGLSEALKLEMVSEKKNVNVTVICPYFIKTGMFEGVKNKFDFLFPIQEPEFIADRILTAVLTNEYQVIIPRLLSVLALLKQALPINSYVRLIEALGANSAMDEFVGRRN